MSTFNRLDVGTTVVSQGRTITESLASDAATIGGYVHPLFTDHEYVRRHTSFEPPLIPGQFVLYLLGGLAEMAGVFDETTIGLVALDDVRFAAPVRVGETIRLEMEVVERRVTSDGTKGVMRLDWTCRSHDDDLKLQCVATMMFAVGGDRSSAATQDER